MIALFLCVGIKSFAHSDGQKGHTMFYHIFDLQLFADGGAGASGGDGGAAAAAGEATGVTAPAAEVQPRAKKRKENPLANVKYGKQMPPAPSQDATGMTEPAADTREEGQTKRSFKDLIEGEYKDEYGEHVQNVIRQRFKANAENEEKLGKMMPIMEMLGRKYDIDPTDIDQIAKIVGDDDELYEEEAIERGMSVESLKMVKQMERENEQLKAREQQSIAEQQMRTHFGRLAQQAEDAKKLYPGLDLRAEMQNPTFARLTSPGVNIDVRTAYEVVHREELRGAEMKYAADKSAERMANAIRSGSMRPVENGLGGNQSTGAVKTDPKSLTRADREEIKRRVRLGEKIIF